MKTKNYKSGIYLIEDGIRYYGGSTVNFDKRWKTHLRNSKTNSTKCPKLYAAMRKYGEDSFRLRPLMVCSKKDLEFYEQRWIDKNIGKSFCLNVSSSCSTPVGRGQRLSENHKEKLRKPKSTTINMKLARVGMKLSETHKENIGNALRGKKYICDRRGRNNKNSKLIDDDIRQIRNLYLTGNYTWANLAVMYGVKSPTTIGNIVNYKSWSNI